MKKHKSKIKKPERKFEKKAENKTEDKIPKLLLEEYILLDLRNNRFPKKCPICGLELKRKKVKKREDDLFQEIVCKGKRKWLFFHEKCPFKKEIVINYDGTG